MNLLPETISYTPILLGFALGLFIIMIMRSFTRRNAPNNEESAPLPVMPRQDFTLDELKIYNGEDHERVLIGCNGKVFDVTAGRNFYGKGGPYHVFAGKDASRAFATFSIEQSSLKDEYDDLSDLNSMEMESLREWEMRLEEKYNFVGNILKPGEKHHNYAESEDELKNEN